MDLGNLLINRVRPDQRLQALDEIVEHVRANYPPRQPFEVRENNSALRNFATEYTVDGMEGYDARSFFRQCERKYNESFTGKPGNKGKINF